jgi:hypothetical protein
VGYGLLSIVVAVAVLLIVLATAGVLMIRALRKVVRELWPH